MAKKTEESKSYEELEKEIEDVMNQLSQENLGLDEATKLYQEGKKIVEEMTSRLEKLTKEASDSIATEE